MTKKVNYNELVGTILNTLPNREKDVLVKRNSLFGTPKHTLEKIGQDYKITRERVRQIENDGIKKIKTIDEASILSVIKALEANINKLIKKFGGFISEDHLIDLLLVEKEVEEELNSLNFLLNHVMSHRFDRVKSHPHLTMIWKGEGVDMDLVAEVTNMVKEKIEKSSNPVHLNVLLEELAELDHLEKVKAVNTENQLVLESLLNSHKELKQNILGQWGVHNWTTVTPKRMTDKAYLVMLKHNKPLHFAEVADLINQSKFDHKVACPATVHNELILDDKYVLVGRGIYALKDWGYEEGTVSDIITALLKESGPMTKSDIIEEVLKQRVVQKTTIILALMNKENFGKEEDKYILA